MKALRESVKLFHSEELAQDLIEYSLVAIIIALGCIVGMTTLATRINTEFGIIASKLT